MTNFAPQLLNPSLDFSESFQKRKQLWYAHEFSILVTGKFLDSKLQGVKGVKNSPKMTKIAKNHNFCPTTFILFVKFFLKVSKNVNNNDINMNLVPLALEKFWFASPRGSKGSIIAQK